jgi:hypothetical protein
MMCADFPPARRRSQRATGNLQAIGLSYFDIGVHR